jgi:curved DNA-binding protein
MTVKFRDYYEILGISRSADEKEIQKAFRKLAAKLHPDVNKAPDAEAKFKELNEAYEVLKDPKKRQLYDQLGPNWKQGQEFSPPPGWKQTDFDHGGVDLGDFSDFFSQLFGGGMRGAFRGGGRSASFGGRQAQAQRGEDFEAELELTLEEAVAGGKKPVQLQSQSVDADGVVRPKLVRYEVAIPDGVVEGTRIRLAGQGGPGAGHGRAGDLLLRVRWQPHPRFAVDGHDLRTIVQITPWEAVLGGEVVVPGLQGSVTLKIAPGSQAGQTLRLRGQGLPRGGGERGDLLAQLRIVVPTSVGERERELLAEWRAASGFAPEQRARHP